MIALDVLKTALLNLSQAVGEKIPLIVGGGFGLYLRQEQLRQSGERTLFEKLPEPRATNDIDLFITMEVLVDVNIVKELQQQIEHMGFKPVKGAEYFQWLGIDDEGREVKIDLLCGPIGKYADRLHTNSLPRIRPKAPKNTVKLHARQTNEAIELDNKMIQIEVTGEDSDGKTRASIIYLPHPFTYLMMKLFAYDDRKNDNKKDEGRHHAMDLYRITAMMTESEYKQAQRIAETYQGDERIIRAQQIISSHFSNSTDLGMLRLREHQLFREEFPLEEFSKVLHEVFQIIENR